MAGSNVLYRGLAERWILKVGTKVPVLKEGLDCRSIVGILDDFFFPLQFHTAAF